MPEPELSVIVPCYNEAKNIPFIVEAFTAITTAHAGVEVLLVNNGSTDNSAAVFEQHIVSGSNIRVVAVPVNQGYGHGILQGLAAAAAPILCWTHADLQTDPADTIRALDLYRKQQDPWLLVRGRRIQRRWAEAFFTTGMQWITNLVLKTRLHDINAQPKLFSRALYTAVVQNAPADFSLDLYFLFMAQQKGRILDFPVVFKPRLYGEAKGGGSLKTRIKLVKRTWKYIFALKRQLASQKRSQQP